MLFVQRNIDSELIICYTFIIRGTDEVRCILWVDKKLYRQDVRDLLNGVVMKGISVCVRLFIELPAVQQKE